MYTDFTRADPTFFAGHSAAIYIKIGDKAQRVGTFGIVHPTVLKNFELPFPVSALGEFLFLPNPQLIDQYQSTDNMQNSSSSPSCRRASYALCEKGTKENIVYARRIEIM